MAIIDSVITTKVNDQAVRIGDVGKTVVRTLPENADINSLEEFYLYTRDAPVTELFIGEINNIQVEQALNKSPEDMKAGEAISYEAYDLL